jgi:hypothetical protein
MGPMTEPLHGPPHDTADALGVQARASNLPTPGQGPQQRLTRPDAGMTHPAFDGSQSARGLAEVGTGALDRSGGRLAVRRTISADFGDRKPAAAAAGLHPVEGRGSEHRKAPVYRTAGSAPSRKRIRQAPGASDRL